MGRFEYPSPAVDFASERGRVRFGSISNVGGRPGTRPSSPGRRPWRDERVILRFERIFRQWVHVTLAIPSLARLRTNHRIAFGMTAAAAVALATWIGATAQQAERPIVVDAVALAALASFSLIRTAPVVPFVASLSAPLLASWAGGTGSDDPFLVLVLAASFGAGRFGRHRDLPYMAAGVLGLMSMNVTAPGPFAFPQQIVFPVVFIAAPWSLGAIVRRAVERETRAVGFAAELSASHSIDLQQATLRERLRVARELHDITAHTMNVVSIQAQVLRRRIEHGQRVEIDDVKAIEASARQAMTELRDMLGALRPAGVPAPSTSQPTIDHLPRLIEECRQSGQDVELEVVGAPREMSAGHSLTVFRIAQECLTNARRHGVAGPVRLTLGWSREHLQITVVNPSSVSSGNERFVDGIGLAGMRERVTICGGKLDVGPLKPGMWVVRVSLPTSTAT